jgi:L-asparaginase II
METNPVLVEAWRGDALESFHRGAVAVVDGDGTLVASLGDIERPVFPRSAVKLLQALPLVESGAADRFDLDDEELALACASHNGEPAHTRSAAAMLAKAGFDHGGARVRRALAVPRSFGAWPGRRWDAAQQPAQQLLGQTRRLRVPGLSAGRRC